MRGLRHGEILRQARLGTLVVGADGAAGEDASDERQREANRRAGSC